ncbi:MAG TPA: antibiotic biosynthesis monooxygenase [Kineosporiaceae bacterium]|nr:antibiotic biosynthesis monooxygenase [Kineosporiaceae bacterium]
MAVTILLELPIRADAENVDEILNFDLPATAAYPGNEGTEVLSDDTRRDTLFLLTRWTTMEAYETYFAWRQSSEGRTRLNEIAAGAPTVHRFRSHLRF